MHDLENLLDDWENYAANLEQSGAGLKDAYGMLERIQGEVSRLKDQGAVAANPQLQSLVDELEILTVTETIKFNRGDYV